MPSVKEQAESAIKRMADDCTFEDVQYELYVLEKIRKAEESIALHGTVSQEEAEKRLSKWLPK